MSNRRNVLFIVVDDLRVQLGCYGMDQVISPNIDALAGDGLLFERAYCQQAICGPSRASVLTGCRPDTTGIYKLDTPVRKAMPDVLTLNEHFRKNGYETISIGKVYHHPKDDLQGWCNDPFQSTGDFKGRGYLTDEAMEAIIAQSKLRNRPIEHGNGPAFEAADVDDDGYHDGLDASAAIHELARLAKLDKPFFLGMGFHKPHLPFNAPKKYWDMYDPAKFRLADNPHAPKNANEFTLEDFGELRNYFGIPQEGPVPDELARRLIHGYCACVTYVDAQLGRLMAEMDRLHLRENTVIILWGDHGWKLGEHGSWCKHSNFELDAQAPLILSTPESHNKGLRTRALVEFVDMYPTLCDLCGLNTPKHCEGTSFAPLLEISDRPWKPAAFGQYPRNRMTVMGYTMRTDRFRYTEWRNRQTGKVLRRELYDHECDEAENVNAIDEPKYAEDVVRLTKMMRAGWKAYQKVQ